MVRTYYFSPSVVPPYNPAHWTLFRAQDSYSLMYKFISNPKTRTPGVCDDRSTESHKPLYQLGRTNEWMHPSVKWRVDMSQAHEKKDFQYKSEHLAAFDYKQKDGIYGWAHKEDSDVWIPEWPITAALKDEDPSTYNENAEMALIDQCLDKDKVRLFLRDHAMAWEKASCSEIDNCRAQTHRAQLFLTRFWLIPLRDLILIPEPQSSAPWNARILSLPFFLWNQISRSSGSSIYSFHLALLL